VKVAGKGECWADDKCKDAECLFTHPSRQAKFKAIAKNDGPKVSMTHEQSKAKVVGEQEKLWREIRKARSPEEKQNAEKAYVSRMEQRQAINHAAPAAKVLNDQCMATVEITDHNSKTKYTGLGVALQDVILVNRHTIAGVKGDVTARYGLEKKVIKLLPHPDHDAKVDAACGGRLFKDNDVVAFPKPKGMLSAKATFEVKEGMDVWLWTRDANGKLTVSGPVPVLGPLKKRKLNMLWNDKDTDFEDEIVFQYKPTSTDGNSGGAVCDQHGNVVGIHCSAPAKFNGGQCATFVPLKKEFLEIRKNSSPPMS